MSTSYQKGQYYISKDKCYLQVEVIHSFLSKQSYWAEGIAREIVEKSIENASLCYGVFRGNPETDRSAQQVGFARVITDFVRFSYLSDVFMIKRHRGKGLSKWLMETIVSEPLLKGTAFHLATKDAHSLYEQFGFEPIPEPENRMLRPPNWDDIYDAHHVKKPWR